MNCQGLICLLPKNAVCPGFELWYRSAVAKLCKPLACTPVPEQRQPILLAVLGNTPAILTEAFYYYARLSSPPTLFTEVHALTTKRGRDIAISTLLQSKKGEGSQFDRLLRRLRIPCSKVTFNENTLYAIRKSTEYGGTDYGIRLQREKIEIPHPIA
jgi:hypothetical protein